MWPLPKGVLKKAINNVGRSGKQVKLKSLASDPKVSSADKGWIKSELNQIEKGKRKTVRNPPGKDLAHERGREAAKGYDYEHSNLQDRDLHRLQHKYDSNGKKNKERVVESTESTVGVVGATAAAKSSSLSTEENQKKSEEIAGELIEFGAKLSDAVENFGTNTFGQNNFGKFVNEINPMNIGISDFFKSMSEVFKEDENSIKNYRNPDSSIR